MAEWTLANFIIYEKEGAIFHEKKFLSFCSRGQKRGNFSSKLWASAPNRQSPREIFEWEVVQGFSLRSPPPLPSWNPISNLDIALFYINLVASSNRINFGLPTVKLHEKNIFKKVYKKLWTHSSLTGFFFLIGGWWGIFFFFFTNLFFHSCPPPPPFYSISDWFFPNTRREEHTTTMHFPRKISTFEKSVVGIPTTLSSLPGGGRGGGCPGRGWKEQHQVFVICLSWKKKKNLLFGALGSSKKNKSYF